MFLAKLPILPAKPPMLLEFRARQAIVAKALVAIGRTHPVADRVSTAPELACQLPRGAV